MPGGEVQLVAYGEENMYLNEQPQITFFKVVYRRYTNFSTETVQTKFIYQANFGKKISCELSKLGDLIHKMWLVIELPDIPILYDLTNTVDKKLKFAWARKIAYALIDYVEIENQENIKRFLKGFLKRHSILFFNLKKKKLKLL